MDGHVSDIRTAGKRSAEDARRTRESIIASALALFSARGFDSTGVREIADKAGVSHGVLRHHFGSKMDIWTSVAEEAFAHYRGIMLPVVEAAADRDEPLVAFREVVSAFIDTTLNTPDYARLFVNETSQQNERADFCQARFSAMHLAIGGLFSRAQERSVALQKHTNDSFFCALMSLTYFPLLHPHAVTTPQFPLPGGAATMHDYICSVLFGD